MYKYTSKKDLRCRKFIFCTVRANLVICHTDQGNLEPKMPTDAELRVFLEKEAGVRYPRPISENARPSQV